MKSAVVSGIEAIKSMSGLESKEKIMESPKLQLYLKTYGMLGLSFITLTVCQILLKNLISSLNETRLLILQYSLLLLAMIFILISGINTIKLREWPRPRLRSITGVGAIITGAVMIVTVSIAIVFILLNMFELLLK